MNEQQFELLPPTPEESMSAEEQSARQEYRRRLAEYLKDPAFRATEGFPLGTDEDILALSDPPYYTACPNPFLQEIVYRWQAERRALRLQLGLPVDEEELYRREPFAADVSEGKNDPIYNAHSYHTKVPHKAIMRYILHYTEPGDIVLDGFCGTGMTGVAAQLCADRKTVESLGYRVDEDGRVWEGEKFISRLGARRAVLNDLSPAATFIAYNYNTPVDARAFARQAERILAEVEQECGWLYETEHVDPAACRLIEKQLNFTKVEPTSCQPDERAGSPLHKGITEFTARRGNLPHWQLPGAHYFITFNTHQRRVLSPAARQIVLDALRFWDGQRLDLISAVVMPDHVHAVLVPRQKSVGVFWDLSELLHSVKSFSANQINQAENQPGETVWQDETYDRIIRNAEEYQHVLSYLASNPVKAGLARCEEEYGWYYLTAALKEEGWKPSPRGKINYTIWSDVFVCPACGVEMVFWDVAVDEAGGTIREAWACPGCGAQLSKSPARESGAQRVERAWETRFDRALGQTIRQARQVPVRINYSLGKKRYEKQPDAADRELLEEIEQADIPYPFPTEQIPKGDKTNDPFNVGLTHVHHFYTRRNLWALATMWNKLGRKQKWLATSFLSRNLTKTNRFVINKHNPKGRINGPLTGTWYIPSEQVEQSALVLFEQKILRTSWSVNGNLISTQSTAQINFPANSVDYIFVDPPFGANYMYSELNFVWESWLKVITNNSPEAIINNTQHKNIVEYQSLMQECFDNFYKLLKPGRWITIEFHNSHNVIWNAIQETLQRSGFVVADVRVLDKVHGGIKAASYSTLTKQDLIISAYKPNGNLEERFRLQAGSEGGAWEFIRYHLGKLPVLNWSNGSLAVNAERQAFLLFDRMVAFHVQRGVLVPLSASEFYAGLEQRFIRRDGMYFLPEQVSEYDRAMLEQGRPAQLPLFVNDEKTAIAWLRQQLDRANGNGPRTLGELTNDFNRVMNRAKHEQLLELSEILHQNFLQDADGRWYVPDHHKASDLEKVRQRALLREFQEYVHSSGRLRTFRSEAIRAGFADCFRKQDYETLIQIAERIPEEVLREDADLLMYYDSALLRRK